MAKTLTKQFDMDQKVYVVRSREGPHGDCQFCGGVGEIRGLDDTQEQCPRCEGSGEAWWCHKVWSVRSGCIKKVSCSAISTTAKSGDKSCSTVTQYWIGGMSGPWRAKEIYTTESGAESLADRRNKKEEARK